MQLVIVDRDGIIDVGAAGKNASVPDWQALPGSLEAMARLGGAGYRMVVICNQPELRKKNASVETLNAVHHQMQQDLLEAGAGIDAVFFCSCPPRKECDCLMPNPGMLLDIAARLRISLEGVPVIATSMAAVEAARAAGAHPMLVGESRDDDRQDAGCDDALECYDDLAQAVDSLIESAEPT